MVPVLISMSSFGAAEVDRHGQLWFTELAKTAGADGSEIRGELLRPTAKDTAAELPALIGKAAVFSSPDGLFTDAGLLDIDAVNRGLNIANTLQAPRLKMSIGGFNESSQSSLHALKEMLATQSIELVIENDQTRSAGSVDALQRFFAAQDVAGLDLGMTFDMGNWHWVGECPLQAALAFAPRVRYIHCKGVQRLPAKWVAVALSDSIAPWRAILRALPCDVPRAIEYPLIGDDLMAVTHAQVAHIRQA